jgi:hypothetical protein
MLTCGCHLPVPFPPAHAFGRDPNRCGAFTLQFRAKSRLNCPKLPLFCAISTYFSPSANAIITAPDGIATYCLPPTIYVIAELTSRLPVLNFHKFFPLFASNAIRYPSSSQAKISPPAVDSVPAQGAR